LTRIEEAPKALLMVGNATTVKVAVLLVAPVPPFVEETAPEVFVKMPAAAPFTLTLTVQVPAAATVPPESEMLLEPAVAVAVPLQVFASPFGVATTMPEGSVSLNANPVSATVLAEGLVIVNVSVLLAFKPIDVGLKALLINGAETMDTDGLEVTFVVSPPPEMVIGTLMDWPAEPVTVPVTVIGG